jgi:hypothetical protein
MIILMMKGNMMCSQPVFQGPHERIIIGCIIQCKMATLSEPLNINMYTSLTVTTYLFCHVCPIHKCNSNICQIFTIMLSNHMVKSNKSASELQCISALIAAKPMGRHAQIELQIAIGVGYKDQM